MLRRGFFTSPAVNVMLFQASAENSDPVCDTQMAMNMPKALTADNLALGAAAGSSETFTLNRVVPLYANGLTLGDHGSVEYDPLFAFVDHFTKNVTAAATTAPAITGPQWM